MTIPGVENRRRGAYAAAVVTNAAHPEAAAAFVEHLCGDAGGAAYTAKGFATTNGGVGARRLFANDAAR